LNIYNEIRGLAEKYKDYTVQIRRKIHEHPELSLQEHETAALIRRELDSMGIAWKAIGETGTVGILPASEAGGCTVALRADIDALPVCEATDLPFASKEKGKMHACCHDAHTAMLLGAARILSSLESRRNTVVFLFQPAEELGVGAKLMLENGVLRGVDAIYSSHIWPDVPAGQICLQSGLLMAGADKFRIRVIGKGGHGSQPERCRNPLPACTAIADGIHQIKSLSISGDIPSALTVGYLQCGTAQNTIPDFGELGGTLRWLDGKARQTVLDRIQRLADSACSMYDCTAELEFTDLCLCVVNDEHCAECAEDALSAMYGESSLAKGYPPVLVGEDFSYYCDKLPSFLSWIGCGHEGQSIGLHSPSIVLDEAVLEKGTALYAAFACGYNKQNEK